MSELKAETSRQNGAQSHGPITPEGKAASSANALKNGFYANVFLLIKGEKQEDYDAHCATIKADWGDAETPGEKKRLDNLCRVEWKIGRAERFEAEAEAAGDRDAAKYYNGVYIKLQVVSRNMNKDLKAAIAERNKLYWDDMARATTIRRADKLKGRETKDLQSLGFVFSLEQVDREIAFEDRVGFAGKVVWGGWGRIRN